MPHPAVARGRCLPRCSAASDRRTTATAASPKPADTSRTSAPLADPSFRPSGDAKRSWPARTLDPKDDLRSVPLLLALGLAVSEPHFNFRDKTTSRDPHLRRMAQTQTSADRNPLRTQERIALIRLENLQHRRAHGVSVQAGHSVTPFARRYSTHAPILLTRISRVTPDSRVSIPCGP
jgi:hypothetical protein